MATTVTLKPSTVYNGSSSYLTITDSNNMCTDTSSSTYGTVQCTRSSTSSYYVYLRGFDFDSVPSDATVSNITIKVKGYQSNGNTSTLYMYSGTSTQVSACGSGSAFGTSASVITFSNTTIDWDTLKSYGSDLGVRINCRRSSRNNANTIYIYGAEIDVTYTVPVYHTVISSTDKGTINPSGSTSVLEGSSYSLSITGVTSPHVTDNGIDVTSQLVQKTGGTETFIPDGNTNSGFTVSNISNAYTDSSSSTYASLELNGGSTGTIYLDLNSNIPSDATISSVACSFTYEYNRNNSSSGYTASCRLYANTTAKGSSYSLVSAGGTAVAKTTIDLTVGTWSATEINNARLYITGTNNASSTHRFLYVYGVSFVVTYSISGVMYVYTISSVTGDHTIVVTESSTQTDVIYYKNNGAWVAATAVYKKVSGSWVLQNDLTNVFNSSTNYVKGN